MEQIKNQIQIEFCKHIMTPVRTDVIRGCNMSVMLPDYLIDCLPNLWIMLMNFFGFLLNNEHDILKFMLLDIRTHSKSF